MNKAQLSQVLEYIDAEWAGITARMSVDEKKARAKHWATEIGTLDFDAVMNAVRELSKGQYMPRTAEIIAAVRNQKPAVKTGRMTCRIWQAGGDEVYDLRNPDGSECMFGRMQGLPEWMQIKFRWMADPTPENTAAWDAYIAACERGEQANTLVAMGGAA